MLSFFGEQCLKDAVVARVKEHQRLDQIIQGTYWEQGKDGVFRGCAIGCVLHSDDHMAYERQLGLPVFLAYIDEHIFESLPADEAKLWPLRFIEAVPVGADLELVFPRFMHWLLSDPEGMRKYANARTLPIIDSLVTMYAKRIEGVPFDLAAAEVAGAAARAAARDAGAAAWAAELAAAEAAGAAARAAARDAGAAAEAAELAAAEAARATWAARAAARATGAADLAAAEAAELAAAEAAGAAARRASIHRQAEYLIALLQAYESKPILMNAPCEERHKWLANVQEAP